MDFRYFLENVPKLIASPLLGEEAQLKMASLDYRKNQKYFDSKVINPRKAAVMMLFYPKKKETHLVFILRNSYPGVHSSQVAFPGGKYETEDLTFDQTALRETYEEIGIAPD